MSFSKGMCIFFVSVLMFVGCKSESQQGNSGSNLTSVTFPDVNRINVDGKIGKRMIIYYSDSVNEVGFNNITYPSMPNSVPTNVTKIDSNEKANNDKPEFKIKHGKKAFKIFIYSDDDAKILIARTSDTNDSISQCPYLVIDIIGTTMPINFTVCPVDVTGAIDPSFEPVVAEVKNATDVNVNVTVADQNRTNLNGFSPNHSTGNWVGWQVVTDATTKKITSIKYNVYTLSKFNLVDRKLDIPYEYNASIKNYTITYKGLVVNDINIENYWYTKVANKGKFLKDEVIEPVLSTTCTDKRETSLITRAEKDVEGKSVDNNRSIYGLSPNAPQLFEYTLNKITCQCKDNAFEMKATMDNHGLTSLRMVCK